MATCRALVVGTDEEEIAVLSVAAVQLLGPDCEVLTMEVETTSIDPGLAWGTERPAVRPATPTSTNPADLGNQPLSEDGATWKAILDGAHRTGASHVVLTDRQQGWFSRTFSGSAAQDLLAHSDVPVALVAADGSSRVIDPHDNPAE